MKAPLIYLDHSIFLFLQLAISKRRFHCNFNKANSILHNIPIKNSKIILIDGFDVSHDIILSNIIDLTDPTCRIILEFEYKNPEITILPFETFAFKR